MDFVGGGSRVHDLLFMTQGHKQVHEPTLNRHQAPTVTTGSPRDGIGPEAGRLRLSHWAGPSVTGSAKVSQSFYGGIIIVILTKGKPVPLVWEFIYKLGEVTRVTSTILPDMGRKCVTEA